jgi:hypothetical protein
VTAYRKPAPYQKPQSYRGAETAPGVGPPNTAAIHTLAYAVPPGRSAVLRGPWVDSTPANGVAVLPYDIGEPQAGVVRLPSNTATAHDTTRRVRWSWPFAGYRKTQPYRKARSYRGLDAYRNPAQSGLSELPFGRATPHEHDTALPWAETSERIDQVSTLPHRVATPHQGERSLPWAALAQHNRTFRGIWDNIRARGGFIALPWGPIGRRGNLYDVPWPVEPNPGEPGSEPLTVPILPVYVMIPTLSAVRLPERTPVRLLSASMSTDAAGWAWSFTASLPAEDLALVNPAGRETPAEIEINVCGYVWTFLVEKFADGRRFGLRSANISGRSRSAILAQPYAPTRSRVQNADRSIAQLADEELAGTAWLMDWQALGFLVPGGTWNYADLAPIDALVRLASTIGARIETDRSALELRAKPLYPVSPWEWTAETPYAILPANIVATADGNWDGGPNANGVYVYSESSSFGALVRITGTAGEIQLPMIVERLATSADPARERGRQVLAEAGRKKTETVRIPLFPSPAAPGLIPVGELLVITDTSGTWRGQCQGIRVDAMREGSALSVRQTLQVERQFR